MKFKSNPMSDLDLESVYLSHGLCTPTHERNIWVMFNENLTNG